MPASEATISRNTPVTLQLTLAIIGSILTATWWIQTRLSEIQFRLTTIERNQADLKQAAQDRWTTADMERWAHLFEALNEGLEVPDVR
jgi:hypothetical protein